MADNEETESTNMSMSQMLIVGFIIVILIGLSYFFEDRNLKISYRMVVALALFTLFNVHMTIKYYKKLRNAEGKQGPKGPQGEEGPSGEPGVCTFSSKCGVDNAGAEIAKSIEEKGEYKDIFGSKYDKFLEHVRTETFPKDEEITGDKSEEQKNVYKLVKALILNFKTTKMTPEDFKSNVFV